MRRVAEFLVIALCGVLIAVINGITRPDGPVERQYVGDPGGPVESPRLSVIIEDVVLATTATRGFYEFTTEETLVIVEWSAAARERQAVVDLTLETDSGLVILPREELSIDNIATVDPGFTLHGSSAFQVPSGDVLGADVVVRSLGGTIGTHSWAVRVTDAVTDHTPHVTRVELPESHVEVTG